MTTFRRRNRSVQFDIIEARVALSAVTIIPPSVPSSQIQHGPLLVSSGSAAAAGQNTQTMKALIGSNPVSGDRLLGTNPSLGTLRHVVAE
jgi:hypothetical protein